ncbi:MAG: ParA family protein [Asticcacaulis sp.]|uniref:ParA family protein n=1 Tax=Asticcacaulis sp. TaxID=1872648 RepID=UPI003F7B792C
MKTLVLANQKGGVGKSAVATQFALYQRRQGLTVLVIDLDHQQNTSRPLRLNETVEVVEFTASDVFEAQRPPPLPDGALVLVGGDDRLSSLERRPSEHNAFANRFLASLKAWSRFDVCIIDTNPNPDIRYAAALIAGTHVLAPIQLNQEAIEGVTALLGHNRYGIGLIQSTLNPELRFLGILPNLVEPTPFQRGNFQALAKNYGSLLLSQRSERGNTFGLIQKRTAIAEAQAAGLFVADLPKTSARDAWREIRPVFDMVLEGMDLAVAGRVSA